MRRFINGLGIVEIVISVGLLALVIMAISQVLQ